MVSQMTASSSSLRQKIDCILDPQSGVGGLYIGSKFDAMDSKKLKDLNITSVLTVASDLGLVFNPKEFTHKVIPAEDYETFSIIKYFEEAVTFIRENIKTRNVLVHCHAGMSRSSTMVIAYLMTEKKMELEESLKYHRSRRSRIAGPNSGFAKQLQVYEETLKSLRSAKVDDTLAVTQGSKDEDSLKEAIPEKTKLEVVNEEVIEEKNEDAL